MLAHMLQRDHARREAVHDRHGRAVPGDARRPGSGSRSASASDRGDRRLQPGRAVDARALLRTGQGRRPGAGAGRRRCLDHRHPPRAGADARQRAEARARREARHLEAQPAGRLDRQGHLALHLRARPAVQPAARSGLRLDRLRAVHAAGRAAARAAGRARTRPSAVSICEPSSRPARRRRPHEPNTSCPTSRRSRPSRSSSCARSPPSSSARCCCSAAARTRSC